ncbi:hypothetical protein J5N97_018805 [Dioscorea zingiberensis]|uniref:Uncharacterized protein n=1 Tax=Dioscorea zingiberensis TaxID=325984 RepID=A0A9D5HBT3_9LILI|nr:hypothetical protein J5N97_018805 [Dioscorea zingiberensis]
MTSIRLTPTATRWRCWSIGSTLCARSGSRSRPPRSSATACDGVTASRASITSRSVVILWSNTSRPLAASAGAKILALPSFMDRRRLRIKPVPDFEVMESNQKLKP